MSNSKKRPKMPPPDDFGETQVNIDIPQDDVEELADWEKTQVGMPSEAPADDWGKTVINYNVSDDEVEEDEFRSDQYSFNERSKEPDWGMTQANINLGKEFEDVDDDFADEAPDGATIPYFKLPEAERAKYQKLPPTPVEKARKEEEKKKKEGGVPTWFWVSAGMMTMFAFALIMLLGVWFLLFNKTGFTVIVKDAQPFSQAIIDHTKPWGVPRADKTIRLSSLKAGQRSITIRRQGYKDDVHKIEGKDGETKTVIATQEKSAQERKGCEEITNTKTREDCANLILNNLPTPVTLKDLDDLIRALNLYYINFASGSADIPPARMEFLKRAASYMKQMPDGVEIEIGGHTDSDGGDADNQALSERRANSVKKAFVGFGIPDKMLTTKGYGETKPKDTNETESGKFQNRRIEYTVTKRPS